MKEKEEKSLRNATLKYSQFLKMADLQLLPSQISRDRSVNGPFSSGCE